MMKKIIAVIPAYNEEARIGKVIEGVSNFVDETIVVDDCSTDNTFNVASRKGAYVIELKQNRGVGFATRIGCDYAVDRGAQIIITLDADGQHNSADIPKLLEPLLSGQAEIVFGMRPRNKQMPFGKRLGNALLSFTARILFNSGIKDILTGFHAFRSSCWHNLRWDSDDYGVVSEIACRTIKNKLRYKQISVETIYDAGKTKGMKKRDGIKSILFMFKWRFKSC